LNPVSLPKRLLVTVDGSEESFLAAQYAIKLAERMKAELSVLHVILLPEYVTEQASSRLEKELRSRGESTLTRVRQAAQGINITLYEKSLITRKSVVSSICDFASNDNADLIITGTRGASGVADMMLGSVATGVAREARCPVLLVR
jgi:nucleotide-binding universal stress UspA family protein